MNKSIIGLIALMLVSTILNAQQLPKQVILPNGWKLSPAGKSFGLGDLPLNIAVSSTGRLMAVTNNGQSTQTIQLIDVKAEKVVDSIVIGKSWYGLTFSNDEKYLYASGGHDNRIVKYAIANNKLAFTDEFIMDKPWPTRVGPSGITIDEQRNRLYVVTREDKQFYSLTSVLKKSFRNWGLMQKPMTVRLARVAKNFLSPVGVVTKYLYMI